MNAIVGWFRQNTGTIKPATLLFSAWCKEQTPLDMALLGWEPSGFGYDRCLIERNEPFFDIFAIRWPPFAESPVHDHAERGCIHVVSEGILEEKMFSATGVASSGTRVLQKNDSSFIDGSLGLHSIKNPAPAPAFSFHLYSPCSHPTMYLRGP